MDPWTFKAGVFKGCTTWSICSDSRVALTEVPSPCLGSRLLQLKPKSRKNPPKYVNPIYILSDQMDHPVDIIHLEGTLMNKITSWLSKVAEYEGTMEKLINHCSLFVLQNQVIFHVAQCLRLPPHSPKFLKKSVIADQKLAQPCEEYIWRNYHVEKIYQIGYLAEWESMRQKLYPFPFPLLSRTATKSC